MYTEDEVNRNKRLAQKKERRGGKSNNDDSLTRLVVRIPEHERHRLQENESK